MKSEVRTALVRLNRKLTTSVATSSRLPFWAQSSFGRVYSWISYQLCKDGRLISSRWPKLPLHQLANLLKPGDVYLDVGASFGDLVTVAQSAVGPHGLVYAFEPQPGVFEVLTAKKENFGWTNVILTQALVGDREGEINFYVEPSTLKSSLSQRWEGGSAVTYPMITLDTWAKNAAIRDADLLKVDVEGAEMLVIQGARDFLRQATPVLLLEINNRAARYRQFGYTVDDLLIELKSLGYDTFFVLRERGLEPFSRESDLCESDQDMLAKVSGKNGAS